MPNSCLSQPFMLLGDPNKAPVLDYHIPQKSCLPIFSYKPNVGKDEWFKPRQKEWSDIFWDNLRDKSVGNIKKLLTSELKTGGSSFTRNLSALQKSIKPVVVYDPSVPISTGTRYESQSSGWVHLVMTMGNTQELAYGYTSIPTKVRNVVPVEITGLKDKLTYREEEIKREYNTLRVPKGLAFEIDLQQMAEKLAGGYLVHFINGYGGLIKISYTLRPNPKTQRLPKLYLKFVQSLCSVTANYGAGETVDTLSLFPGERRSISVRTYMHSASTRSRSENIIDSMSESSVQSLENAIQNSSGTSSSTGTATSETDPGTTVSVGTSMIQDLIFGSADASFQEPSTGSTTQSQLTNTASSITSAVSMQVNESNHFRNVSINSSSTQETQFGEENLLVREFSNINQSRTLNFVFRRLLQHYHTFLILKDIKFGIVYFEDGFFKNKEVGIDKLESLIQEFIHPDFQTEALQSLIKQSAFIFNYKNELKQLFDCGEYKQPEIKCECYEFVIPAEQICRWIKLPVTDTYADFTFEGIILNHSEHVLKTSSLLVDAFLGQGEALDCYNSKLQEQNIIGMELNNKRTDQAINIIEGFTTSQEKADNYKKIYGECCDDKTT